MPTRDRRAAFRRLRRRLERLLDLPVERRTRALSRLQRTSPELARDLAALLAADAAPGGPLDRSADLYLPLLALPPEESD